MSRRGNCYDNAVMEAFFSRLKIELADSFENRDDATRQWFEHIEVCFITSAVATPRSATGVRLTRHLRKSPGPGGVDALASNAGASRASMPRSSRWLRAAAAVAVA
jgi:hypothetical protein